MAIDLLIAFVSSFIASFGFCFVYEVHGRVIFPASIGGAVTWLTYVITRELGIGQFLPYFYGAVALSIYAEVMSRVYKSPATVFLIIGLLPLVPGSGIYNTMLAFVEGDIDRFVQHGTQTLGISGVLALALLAVSSVVRFVQVMQRRGKQLSRRL